jgi:hypothetical protein
MWAWAIVFVCMLGWEIVSALYIRRAAQGNALPAAFWGGKKWLFGTFVVLQYTQDPWLVVPSYFGSVLGTYCAVKYDSRGVAPRKPASGRDGTPPSPVPARRSPSRG